MSVSHESAGEADVSNVGAVVPNPAGRSPWWAGGRSAPLFGIVAVALAAASLGRVTGAGAPDLLLPTGIIGMVVLAYANGANDVSKAIATLVGSGATNYRRAIAWGAAWTVSGALCSVLIASALIGAFTSGFIASGAHETEVFALAVVLGAVLWVFLATRIAMPVSTTHAIAGALVGTGAVAFGADNIRWIAIVRKVALPLVLSPFLALTLALIVYLLVHLTLAHRKQRTLNGLHWLSSGMTSFARSLNDTPKIVALGVAFYLITRHSAASPTPYWLFALVALGMGVGSVIGGLRVTKTLAEKVTTMDHVEGFAANLTTAALVAVASNFGLPVSTTHVSAGAIIGIGLRNGVARVNWRTVRDMTLAWLVTLPLACLLGILAYVVLLLVHGSG